MRRTTLIDLAGAIADGAPVAWDRLESAGDLSSDLIAGAQLVERIARAHSELPPAASFSSAPPLPLPHDDGDVPTTWGPLTIVDRIGRGTFGDVYRARDPRLDRPVALKLLRRRDRRESAVIEEGHLMARVRHSNIVTIYGAERINGRVGLWMEFVDGPTLEQELQTRGPFSPDEIVAIGLDLCGALAAVHRAGMLHRDLKAQNVMRDRDGRVLLTDFGAGRDLSETGPADRELAGTPLYLAPEVLAGQSASAASDVYSLGVLLYHVATGTFPVRGHSLRELEEKHARAMRTPVGTARRDVPAPLAAVIERATTPDPNQRFQSAEDLAAALRRIGGRPGRRRVAAMAAAFVLIASAASLAIWKFRPDAPAARLAFQPRDMVLITQFENRTGDPLMDGSLEIALERELNKSDTVGLISRDRVQDALELMRQPSDTVVTRAIGREISVRDGGVKALVAGRVEKFGLRLVLTAQLVDPADDSTVATVSEEAPNEDAVLGALTRVAGRVRAVLGEQQNRIRGSDPVKMPASTSSLRAFKLFNQSKSLTAQGTRSAARDLAQQAVEADPSFGSAWIQLAFTTASTSGNLPFALRSQSTQDAIRPFLDRALALADNAPEWERYWITGSYHFARGEYGLAVPQYQALVKLRPDHPEAPNQLQATLTFLGRLDEFADTWASIARLRPNNLQANSRAAETLILHRRDVEAARPFIDRMKVLLTGDPFANPLQATPARWLSSLPVYEAWKRGDIDSANAATDRVLASVPRDAGRPHDFGVVFALSLVLSLGRLGEANALARSISDPVLRNNNLPGVAEAVGDRELLRTVLAAVKPNTGFAARFARAGLLDQARQALAGPKAVLGDDAMFELGVGELALAEGRPADALSHFNTALIAQKSVARSNANYYAGCQSLATALQRLGRSAEALSALEACAEESPRYGGNLPAYTWLQLEMRLADEYRAVGRVDAARKIEDSLRKLLSHADADHPLVIRLQARQAR